MPVQMNVIAHQLVGGYLSRLTLSGARPATVAQLMADLAEFANDALGVEAMQARYDAPTRTWRIPGVLELIDIDETATASFHESTAQNLAIRLPDRDLLAENRNLAVAYDAGRVRGGFSLSGFYRDYAQSGPYELSNSDFLDSRIADYVFATCR